MLISEVTVAYVYTWYVFECVFCTFFAYTKQTIWVACVGQVLACSWLFNLSTASLLLYRNVNKEITEQRCVVIKVYKVQCLQRACYGSIFSRCFPQSPEKRLQTLVQLKSPFPGTSAPIGQLKAVVLIFPSCSVWPDSTCLPYNLHYPQLRFYPEDGGSSFLRNAFKQHG